MALLFSACVPSKTKRWREEGGTGEKEIKMAVKVNGSVSYEYDDIVGVYFSLV
jgi:hypothetical protein